jgi:hypothetical protein
VLLTFGLACPILGLMIVVTIVNDCNVWKLLVGRKMTMIGVGMGMEGAQHIVASEASSSSSSHVHVKGGRNISNTSSSSEILMIESENKDVWRGLFACWPMCVSTVSVFWALLFFDMVSDPYNNTAGMAATLGFSFLLPLAILLYSKGLRRRPDLDPFMSFSRRLLRLDKSRPMFLDRPDLT